MAGRKKEALHALFSRKLMHERVDRVGLALERPLELGQARLEQTKKRRPRAVWIRCSSKYSGMQTRNRLL